MARPFTVDTVVPARLELKVKVEASSAKEARKLATKLFRRVYDDNYTEKGWNGLIDHEEVPEFELKQVKLKGMKLKAWDENATPVMWCNSQGEVVVSKNKEEFQLARAKDEELRKKKPKKRAARK